MSLLDLPIECLKFADGKDKIIEVMPSKGKFIVKFIDDKDGLAYMLEVDSNGETCYRNGCELNNVVLNDKGYADYLMNKLLTDSNINN